MSNIRYIGGRFVNTRGYFHCKYVPTVYRGEHGWVCGTHGPSCEEHINVFKTDDLPQPPPPPPPIEDETAPFVPFECSICINACLQKDESVTTICNHRFHKGCLEKWSNMGMSQTACPLCRTTIQSISIYNVLTNEQVMDLDMAFGQNDFRTFGSARPVGSSPLTLGSAVTFGSSRFGAP